MENQRSHKEYQIRDGEKEIELTEIKAHPSMGWTRR